MHSCKNHITQFLRKMQALIIFYINNIFTDISTKHKIIAICKKQLAKLKHKFLFYTYRKEKHNQNYIESIVESRSEKVIIKTLGNP